MLEKIGDSLYRRGNELGEIKPMSLRRFTWEVHKLVIKIAVFAGVVAWVASHGR